MFSKAKSDKGTQDKGAPKTPLKTRSSMSSDASASSSMSGKKPGAQRAGVPSLISADVVMKGNINSAGEVQFDGTLEGDIKAGTLMIGEKAVIKGEVISEMVTVRGTVEGGIRAKAVALAATAHIRGDILHSSLAVENGAHFEGNCRHSDDPLSESSAKDFRRSRPAASRPNPAAPADKASNDSDKPAAGGKTDTPSFLTQGRSPLR